LLKINELEIKEIQDIANFMLGSVIELNNMELDEMKYINMLNDISKEFFIGLNKKFLLDKYLNLFSEIELIIKKIKKFQEKNNYIIIVIERIYSRIISLVNEFILSKCTSFENDNYEKSFINMAYLTKILVKSKIDFFEKEPVFFATNNIAVSKLNINVTIMNSDIITLEYKMFFDSVENIWYIQMDSNLENKSELMKIVYYDNRNEIVYDESIISQINSKNIQILDPRLDKLLE